MIKNMLSKIFILSGFTLIIISLCLFIQNKETEDELKDSTSDILVELFAETEEIKKAENSNEKPKDFLEIEEKTEIMVDNSKYSFILNIPSLNLQLPIQSDWSYNNLNISPCIYKEEPLSIAAHNYQSHFGNLANLKLNETVSIEYFSGATDEYKVVSVTKIHETDVEKLNDANYDLSLFTCNYSNNAERILVRLNKIS